MRQRVEFGGIAFMSGLKYSLLSFEPNEINAQYQTASYIGQDGTDVLGANYEPRYVTLQGHIMARSTAEHFALRQKLISLCDGKTERDLIYFEGLHHYKAKAIAAVPVFSGRQGFCLPFTIKFTIPSFFWTDKDETERSIVNYIPLISTFNFDPLFEFSQTVTQATISNSDVPTPFIIEVKGRGGTPSDTYGITITNETTGEVIKIERDIADGELITIDTENATATSSVSGDIITSISDDSIIDMMLASGNNVIKAENLNVNNDVSVVIKYRNRFVGV